MAIRFVDIDVIHIDLIDKVNPFQKAFEVLSKSVTTQVLRVIQETIEATRISMTEAEVLILYPKIKDFIRTHGKKPDLGSNDPLERRMADAIIYINDQMRQRNGEQLAVQFIG